MQQGRSSTAWWVLAVGVVVATASLALPPDLRDATRALVIVLGLVAVVLGTRRHRPELAVAWRLIAGGLAAWLVAGAARVWADGAPRSATLLVELVMLAGYGLVAAGLLVLVAGRALPRNPTALLDSLVVATGLGYAGWLTAGSARWSSGQGLPEQVVVAIQPSGDVLLLALYLYMITSARARSVSTGLMGAALATMILVDVLVRAVLTGLEPAAQESASQLTAALGYVLFGAAALHPSMRRVSERRLVRDRSLRPARLAVLAVAVLLLPVATAVHLVGGGAVDGVTVVVVFFVLISLILVRMLWMVRQLREQSCRLERLAQTDYVTGLENRRRFSLRVADDLGAVTRGTAVMLVAVERFTEINDTLGERTGDELLAAVGARLAETISSDGVVARMGVDSFGVLLPGTSRPHEGIEQALCFRARGLRSAMTEPFTLTELTVSVDIAVGIVLAPQDGRDVDEVLHRADLALSAARSHPDRIARYAEGMETGGTRAPQLMSELRQALLDEDVVVHFQPQVEIATGRVLGVEALVRWQHPEHGLLSPASFVPAAERTGLIRLLTLYVLDRTLAQSALWRAAGLDLSVSVNLSVRNLLDPGLVHDVEDALRRHAVEPGRLELEITETMAMVDPNRSMEVLGALDALGVLLSVDDYGTGYSSLAYLQRLPVRRLKIDRSFVAGVMDDDASAAIVRSTIELARHLGLSVVAEGVEDDPTLRSLLEMRCYAAQGFGLGRPVCAEAVPELIRAIETRVPAVVGVPSLRRPSALAFAPTARRAEHTGRT